MLRHLAQKTEQSFDYNPHSGTIVYLPARVCVKLENTMLLSNHRRAPSAISSYVDGGHHSRGQHKVFACTHGRCGWLHVTRPGQGTSHMKGQRRDEDDVHYWVSWANDRRWKHGGTSRETTCDFVLLFHVFMRHKNRGLLMLRTYRCFTEETFRYSSPPA